MADNRLEIKIVADNRQAVSAIGEQARAMGMLAQKVEVVQTSMRKMAVAVASGQAALAGIGAAVKGVFLDLPRSLLDGALAAEKMQKAFTTLEGSLSSARDQIRFVTTEANRLGIPLAEASDAWLKLAAAARGTALEGDDARRIFSAVAGAASTLGLSASETSGALLAISQMMSKGTVQAEELRGQLGERIPGAFQIAARAMGVSTQALGDMLDRGELLASDFLPKFAAQLSKEIPASVDGTQNAINRLGNATEEWRRLTGSALAVAIDGFFGLKRMTGEVGKDDSLVEFARKSAKAIAALIDVVREFVLFVPNVLKTIGGLIAAVARDIKLAFDIAAAAITEGIGEKGRNAMKRALDERNAFIQAYNDDMAQRWFPKHLATRVDEFFGDLAKRSADASAKASTFVEAELTKDQQKTIDAIRSGDQKLQAEYKAHANNLYAALTSGAIDISRYNELRARLEQWYAEQKKKLVKDSGVSSVVSARLAAAKDAIDAELIVLKDGLARAKAAYDAALQDRLISIKDYYAAKTAIEQREIDAEISRQQQMLAAQQAVAANPNVSESDRIRAKGDVQKIEAELIVLNSKRAAVEQSNARASEKAERELADALAAAREELAQITGTATDADRRAAIERSYRDLRARLAAESDAEGVSLVDKLIDVKAAQANLARLEQEWRLVTERLRNAQEAIGIQQQAGLITEAQARERIVALQQQSAVEMQRLLPAMQQAAQAIGPEAVIRVEAWRNELERTRLVTDELAPLWNRIGEGFGNALQGMVTSAQTLREALVSIFRSILDAFLQHLVIQPFQQWVAMQARMLAMKLGFTQQEAAIEQAAAAQSVATKQAEAAAKVSANAAEAGSGAAASQASIPVVGPGLAIAAMAAMVAAVMALMGSIKKFASGGYVTGPGTSTSDSIPARLSAGEYVVRAAAVRRVGVAFLDAINGMKAPPAWDGQRLALAAGGLVPQVQVQPAAPQVSQAVRIVNAIDPSVTHDHLQTPAGERLIVNIIGRNAGAVRAALQG